MKIILYKKKEVKAKISSEIYYKLQYLINDRFFFNYVKRMVDGIEKKSMKKIDVEKMIKKKYFVMR